MSRCVTRICMSAMTVVVAFSALYGQKLDNDSLVLLGSVGSIKTTDKEDRRLYAISLRLQFRNDSDKTLLVLNPTYMSRKVEFLYQSMGNESRPPDEFEKTVSTFPLKSQVLEYLSVDGWDWMEWWIKSLDQSSPKQAGVLILKPGVAYEYSDTINLQQKFQLEGPKGKQIKVWDGFSDSGKAQNGLPLSDLPAFTIEYHVSIGNENKNSEILLDLQRRWAPYGRLVLDDKNGFTLKSRRILNSDGR